MAAWYVLCEVALTETPRYIGSGSSQGNPYGLAAIGAVTFPLAMFFRIYFPGPVLTAVFGPVTFALVLGYVSVV